MGAVVGEHGVDFVGHGLEQGAEEVRSDPGYGFLMHFDKGELGRSVDGDLEMIRAAGLGVAFHAKPVVAGQVRAKVAHADLRALLFAQGYPASVFVT